MTTEKLAARVMGLPESITDNYPPRPGTPGAPAPTRETIHAWMEGQRLAILTAAQNTINMALRFAGRGETQAAADLRDEAKALLSLAKELGDVMYGPPKK